MKLSKYLILLFALYANLWPQNRITDIPIMFTCSHNGLEWNVDPVKLINNGSSPSAVYSNNQIFLYYIDDSLSLITSKDQGYSFKHSNVFIKRQSRGVMQDINVIFHNNRFIMFFILSGKECNSLRSAISYDGYTYVENPNSIYEEKGIFKPDAYIYNNMWIINLTLGGDLIRITSEDGISYKRDIHYFIPSVMYSSTIIRDNTRTTFYTGDYAINRFTEKINAIKNEGIVFKDRNLFISEPSVIFANDSSYFMFYKKILPNDFIDTCGCEKKLEIGW